MIILGPIAVVPFSVAATVTIQHSLQYSSSFSPFVLSLFLSLILSISKRFIENRAHSKNLAQLSSWQKQIRFRSGELFSEMTDVNALLDYCSPVNTVVIVCSRDDGMVFFRPVDSVDLCSIVKTVQSSHFHWILTEDGTDLIPEGFSCIFLFPVGLPSQRFETM